MMSFKKIAMSNISILKEKWANDKVISKEYGGGGKAYANKHTLKQPLIILQSISEKQFDNIYQNP